MTHFQMSGDEMTERTKIFVSFFVSLVGHIESIRVA